jgi:predicted 3-demethylubiquinone-9 3-methyltransferase (glyoxalase superfamily)
MTQLKNKITPHLWFNTEAKEAGEFYASVFPDSAVDYIAEIRGTPSGDCDVVSFHISDQPFMAISAGPLFKINPSVSFFLNFDPSKDPDARKNIDAVWEKLSAGGMALMPLDAYPFSERFGWVQDKFGVSWQLILSNPGGERPFVVPSLMFIGNNCGKAEDAMKFYLSVFNGSKQGTVVRYGKGQEPDKEGTVMFSDFMIGNRWIAAMDSAHDHKFAFNEAISLIIPCDTQEEIDYFWQKLSAVPEAEQCGWCKDKYGLSWQVWPTVEGEMMRNGTREQIDRLTKTFLPMKKLDITKLTKAYEGHS